MSAYPYICRREYVCIFPMGFNANSYSQTNSKSDALSGFTSGNTFSSKQITFVEMVVAQLTEHGIADRKSFYDPPFTDVAPAGPSGLFDQSKLAVLDRLLDDVIGTATPR